MRVFLIMSSALIASLFLKFVELVYRLQRGQ